MSRDLNPNILQGNSTDDIVNSLIRLVTKSEEEIRDEKREQRKQNTDLKIFLARKEGFEIGTTEESLQELATDEDIHQNTRDYIDNHGFTETVLNDEVSYLEIRTPSYERTDQFILIESENYLRTLTVERRYWTKRTIERILDYLPGLSRLYLSANDIDDIVAGLSEITETQVSGFTSKLRSFTGDRRLSIQFHGGDEEDIKHVEEEFGAKPTRVEFRQKNSPVDAVSGAITRKGRINVPGIKAGSEELGAETLESVASEFEHLDQEHYSVPHAPRIQNNDSGLVIEGFTTLRLGDNGRHESAIADGGREECSLGKVLEEEVLDSKQRYDYQQWMEDDFLLLDKERSETFHVGVEDEDLIVNARPETTPITLKEFSQIILEEFRTTYDISSRSTNLLKHR